MSYCTQDDILNRMPEAVLIKLTDDENNGTVNAGRVSDAIASADSEIDSYCGKRYTVPFTTVPEAVKNLSVEISIYYLYARQNVPDEINTRYQNALKKLRDISSGRATVGVDPEPAAPSYGQPESNKTSSDRVFTNGSLRDF